jgi:hypothetical protein
LPQYDKIIFSIHAKERMAERFIEKGIVLEVLKDPTNSKPGTGKRNIVFFKKIDGTVFNVVVEEKPRSADGQKTGIILSTFQY